LAAAAAIAARRNAKGKVSAGAGARSLRRPGWPFGRIRIRLLPITIFVAVLLLGVRIGDLWQTVSNGQGLPEPAPLQAQTNVPATGASPQQQVAQRAGAADKMEPPIDTKGGDTKGGDAKGGKGADGPRGVLPPEESGRKLGEVDTEVFRRMAERREQLDKRARELDEREALLVVAEKRIDEKMDELRAMQSELQLRLGQLDKKQEERIDRLVKVYESMKPKEAARILENLDQPVLFNVVERMKENKIAPILAAMDPLKAKEITAGLAERRQLPILPQ